MPQDRPPLRKMVFIAFDGGPGWTSQTSQTHKQAKLIGLWIYQRLKYSGFPMRTYIADVAIGGGGFTTNSIDVASPFIAVLSSTADNNYTILSVKEAIDKGKDVIVVLCDKEASNLAAGLPCVVMDFSEPQEREASYQALKNNLTLRDYPIVHWQSFHSDFTTLAQARRFLSEYQSSTSSYRSDFYYEYMYLQIFSYTHNHVERAQAILDLGEHNLLEGIVLACLQEDPHPEVRAAAALALARFDDYDTAVMLHEAMKVPRWPPEKRRNTGLAYAVQQDPLLAEKLALTISSWTPRVLQMPTSPNESRGAAAQIVSESPPAHYDAFISYARTDSEEYAVKLANWLRERGFSIWIDTNLEPGSPSWLEDIEKAIRESSVVVALISPSFSQSRWTQREIFLADQMSIPIIPIKVFHSDRPMLISTTQGLRGDPLLSVDFATVLEQLAAHLQRQFRAKDESNAMG